MVGALERKRRMPHLWHSLEEQFGIHDRNLLELAVQGIVRLQSQSFWNIVYLSQDGSNEADEGFERIVKFKPRDSKDELHQSASVAARDEGQEKLLKHTMAGTTATMAIVRNFLIMFIMVVVGIVPVVSATKVSVS